MARLWLLHLRFTSPLHHVVGRGGYPEQGGELPGNDTILSAVAAAYHQLTGSFPQSWIDHLALSSLLPVRWGRLYLPIPPKVLADPEKNPLRQKVLNRIGWLRASGEHWGRWARGEWEEVAESIVKEEEKRLGGEEDNVPKRERFYLTRGDWFQTEVRERVALHPVHRNRPANSDVWGSPAPYRVVSLVFTPEGRELGEGSPSPNAALLLYFSDDQVEEAERFVKTLRLVGEHFGLGGDRSLGYGRFELLSVEEDYSPPCPSQSEYSMTLGYLLPTEDELKGIDWPRSHWGYQWREGWNRLWGTKNGQPGWVPVRSERVRMVSPASLLRWREGQRGGFSCAGKKEDLFPKTYDPSRQEGFEAEESSRRIWRSGKTVLIPVGVPMSFKGETEKLAGAGEEEGPGMQDDPLEVSAGG